MIKSLNNNNNKFLILIEYCISILLCHFMAIIFGAPLINQFFNTFMFSCLLATITFLPLIVLIPHDNGFVLIERLLIDRNFNNDFEYKCSTASIFSIIGAWLGKKVNFYLFLLRFLKRN
jgi:hypothetical protein